MEELKDKTYIIKVPNEIFKYLNDNKGKEIGKLQISQGEMKMKFAIDKDSSKKSSENDNTPKLPEFTLINRKTDDYFYFSEQVKKEEDLKLNKIHNFSKLILPREEESNQFIQKLTEQEMKKTKPIQIIPVKDIQNKINIENQKKTGFEKDYGNNKKDKRVRKDDRIVEEDLKEILRKGGKNHIKEMANTLDVPDGQVKEILKKIADEKTEGKRKYYVLKPSYE